MGTIEDNYIGNMIIDIEKNKVKKVYNRNVPKNNKIKMPEPVNSYSTFSEIYLYVIVIEFKDSEEVTLINFVDEMSRNNGFTFLSSELFKPAFR